MYSQQCIYVGMHVLKE